MESSRTHLDCTLRDGGYYTNWDFDHSLVQSYLSSLSNLSIKVCELGYRSLPRLHFSGPLAYTTDSYLQTLNIPPSLDVAVMINAADFNCSPSHIPQLVSQIFSPASESKVTIVRIATHIDYPPTLPALIHCVSSLGYRICLNLMQVSEIETPSLIKFLLEFSNLSNHPIEVLYLADSLGALTPSTLSSLSETVSQYWNRDLGIHLHDNQSNATFLTSLALTKGFTWYDSTVLGMGRGPGNAKTELLVLDSLCSETCGSDILSLTLLTNNYFQPLRETYRWGTNPFYYLSSLYRIHPTFIQEMLSDQRYSESDILFAIDYLKSTDSSRYNTSTLLASKNFYVTTSSGSWDPSSELDVSEVLIVGSGQSSKTHSTAIESYIREHHPIVIALNTTKHIDNSLVTYRAACHPLRITLDHGFYHSLPNPLIAPLSSLDPSIQQSLRHLDIRDYAMSVQPDTFEFNQQYCIVPSPLVISYVLSLCASIRAPRVLLSGIDGYQLGDPRNAELETTFLLFQSHPDSVPLLSITPTIYKVPTTSIYAL